MIESNSPAYGHAPKPTNPGATRSLGWVAAGLGLGVLTGAIGTVFHLGSYWTGSFGIPWGIGVALLLAGLAQWWIALRSTSIVAAGLTGVAQYLTLAAMTLLSRGDTLTVPYNEQTWQFVPHLVIATLVWHAGIVLVTMINLVRLSRTIGRTRTAPDVLSTTQPPGYGGW